MRKDRIASVLGRAVSEIIEHQLRDPRLGLVTITSVDVASDLKTAVIYFSSLEDKQTNLTTLNRAKNYIRSELAGRVRMRYLPEIEFRIDDSFEYGTKIDALLDEIGQGDKE